MVAMFSWNPLYHIIDQGRGYIFVNYNPLKSSLSYPIVVSIVITIIGIVLVAKTARHVSLSWSAAQ